MLEGNPGPGAIKDYLAALFSEGITSVLVEGGARLLQSFIESGIWDLARVETAPFHACRGVKSPVLGRLPDRQLKIGDNQLYYFSNNPLLWR